ncbi:MAG: hypothetical protein ACKPKO_61670, partial [Candidatus Fonsibacter sp.]
MSAARVTSRIIKEEAEESAVVTHVADLDLANVIYTILEETEVEVQMAAAVGKDPTVQIVAGVTEIDDDEEMPAVEIDVTGETPIEEPQQYKLIPSEE